MHPSFVALQHRNFRLLWIGLLVSFTGSMMQNAALLWHVSLLAPPESRASRSASSGSSASFRSSSSRWWVASLPTASDRRKLMIATQASGALVATALAVLALRDVSALWPVYTLAALGGAASAFDLPARQSRMPILVPLTDRIERRGRVLMWAIAAYGTATIAFGVSHSFWLAFASLAVTGAADTVSAIIHNVVRQLETSDRLRGRMTGINMVFFIGGPQLGELEAGLVAQFAGARMSVVTGGVACLIATAVVAAATPGLQRYRKSWAVGR